MSIADALAMRAGGIGVANAGVSVFGVGLGGIDAVVVSRSAFIVGGFVAIGVEVTVGLVVGGLTLAASTAAVAAACFFDRTRHV
ncbi:MAG: hypothetical protein WCD62_18260, partial [Pseudolabrys sp.]